MFFEDHEFYRYGLPRALERLGHEVWIPTPEERGSAIAYHLYRRRPELVLSMGWTAWATDTDAWTIIQRYCRDQPALHVYWSTEDPIHTEVWVVPYIQRVNPDAVMTISPTAVGFFRDFGFYSDELPFAAIPEIHRPNTLSAQRPIDVALVATLYGETSGNLRNIALASRLRPLIGMPWTVGIWGSGWEDARRHLGFTVPPQWIHPAIPFCTVPGIYNASRVVLCPQNDPNHLTSRTFEVLGTGGGVLLSWRTPAVRRFFVEGQHLLASGSAQETLRVVQHYLANERARQLISNAGRQEVLKRHTYDHRAAFLMNRVATRLQEKRQHRDSARPVAIRQVLQPAVQWSDAFKVASGTGGSLRLAFDMPKAPEGFKLCGATLECFADSVGKPGIVLCLDASDTVLDATYVNVVNSSPYPYRENWCRWNVVEAARRRIGALLELLLVHTDDVVVNWFTPLSRSSRAIVQYRMEAFTPRLALWWSKGSERLG
ncbi:MAG: glycosyltransferase [Firmicutes bacterium]|nr:glycosyltransferase [Bacillota bacterium]